MCLKAFLEFIRMTTFGTHGYQQIQVNAAYMTQGLSEFVDKSSLSPIIEELLASAEERTVDPVPMEPSVSFVVLPISNIFTDYRANL